MDWNKSKGKFILYAVWYLDWLYCKYFYWVSQNKLCIICISNTVMWICAICSDSLSNIKVGANLIHLCKVVLPKYSNYSAMSFNTGCPIPCVHFNTERSTRAGHITGDTHGMTLDEPPKPGSKVVPGILGLWLFMIILACIVILPCTLFEIYVLDWTDPGRFRFF